MIAIIPFEATGRPTLVSMANLDETSKQAVALLIATLCDPAMSTQRYEFMRGELALVIGPDGDASLVRTQTTPTHPSA